MKNAMTDSRPQAIATPTIRPTSRPTRPALALAILTLVVSHALPSHAVAAPLASPDGHLAVDVTVGPGWLQPMSVAQTGWANTNPSYEELYRVGVPAGTPSPLKSGWAFPALFQTGTPSNPVWVALTEAGIDGTFHASRLQARSPNGVYRIGGPSAPEVFTNGALLAHTSGTLTSPWRVLSIGSLAQVVDSTLGTDLAAPAVAAPVGQPGRASWSWAILKDDATVYDVQQQFIDYAADMGWEYTLVDADWDRKIGYDKMRELAQYALSKKVGMLVWYNSSGPWNKTEYTPKGKLLERDARRAEFARLQTMGIKGVKVDFFAGDGQSMIAYYLDILKDAADYGLLVNFHGATLPRSWDHSKFVDGFPGRYAVIARKAGDTWYVAGINAEEGARTLALDLSFVGPRRGQLITDGAGPREFTQAVIEAALEAGSTTQITMQPHGGFVAVFK